MKILLSILATITVTLSYSQDYFTKKNASPEVQVLLKKYNAKEIGFFSNSKYNLASKEFNLFLLKDKKTKLWGVMASKEWNNDEHEYLIKPNYDSIGDFTNENSLVILKKSDKYGVIYMDWKSNSLKPYCKYDEIEIVSNDYGDHTIVRKGKKWGLFQYDHNLLSIPCIYLNKDDVPLYSMSSYEYENYLKVKKKFFIIGYRPDGNGDGVFYGCNSKHKWGLFQMDKLLIPMNYDSIEPMSFNAPFLIVYQNGKAGIYSNPFGSIKMTVKCQFEELKRFTTNGYFLCAVRKNDKWAILDWYTGKLLTEYNYDSYETITVPRGIKSDYYK